MRLKVGLLLMLFLCIGTEVAFSEFEEYELKAVYLERIARFIEWPHESMASSAGDSFVIAILGDNPFGTKLEDLYANRKIKDKRIKLVYLSRLEEMERCHLLFISRSEREELSRILEVTRTKPILTVGDTKGFAEKGVLVNFFIEEGKLRFEVNEEAFNETGISIDSLILKVSKIVNPINKTQ